MENKLEQCTNSVLENLRRGSIYSHSVYCEYNPQRKILSFHQQPDSRSLATKRTIDDLFQQEEIDVAEFYDLGRSVRKATSMAPFERMFAKRLIMEIAKKTPLPKFKNHLYRFMGVDIPHPAEVIVAPNVYVDFLYPELLHIEPGVFIGEEAVLTTHYFVRQKFVLGSIEIGKDCTVGARSVLTPGTKLGERVTVGINAVVRGQVAPDTKIEPNANYIGTR